MLYSDRDIIISDSIDGDLEELYDFMEKYEIKLNLLTLYLDYEDNPLSEPFISIKPSIHRNRVFSEVTYLSTRELTAIVGRKNESKEEQGYPRTKLLIVQIN